MPDIPLQTQGLYQMFGKPLTPLTGLTALTPLSVNIAKLTNFLCLTSLYKPKVCIRCLASFLTPLIHRQTSLIDRQTSLKGLEAYCPLHCEAMSRRRFLLCNSKGMSGLLPPQGGEDFCYATVKGCQAYCPPKGEKIFAS